MIAMQKRDFIQTASIHFMPVTEWSLDKSIRYAEGLWKRLDEKGYGESKSYTMKDKALVLNHYEKLSDHQRKYFDIFWTTYNVKEAKQKSAAVWLALGDLSDEKYKHIIKAAEMAAEKNKKLPKDITPLYPERWLAYKKFDDVLPTEGEKEQKKAVQKENQLSKIIGELNHAKRMVSLMPSDTYWPGEIIRLTDLIKKAKSEASNV